MNTNLTMQKWLEQARENFFKTDFKKLDSALTPMEQEEWNSIYASFRSGSLMQGQVIGTECINLPLMDADGSTSHSKLLCLSVMPYRVKILIPEPFIWQEDDKRESFVANNMSGAKIDFVIVAVDREAQCAIASRTLALERRQWETREISRLQPDSFVDCDVLSVGPTLLTLSTCGYDRTLSQAGLSYSYLGDLREIYHPGQCLKAKVLRISEKDFEISVKEAEPNPYLGAEYRHPVGSSRLASIVSKYAGGVFARLSDGCTVVCQYARQFTDDQFHVGDTVNIQITAYSDDKQWLRGKIKGKLG